MLDLHALWELAEPFVIVAFILLFVGLGGLLIYSGASNQLVQWRQTKRATRTTGELLSTDIERESENGYYPQVEFEYEANGLMLTGDDIYPGTVTIGETSRSDAEELLDSLADEEPLSVFVDRDDPETAFLRKRVKTVDNLLISVVGVMIFGGGLFGAAMFWLTYL